ncbi:hypothetical protein VTK56DRAFT_4711 [Thermocarpiscus australiensis]
MEDLDAQMQDLDDFVSRAKSHNAGHHERHAESVQNLNTTVGQSFSNISGHFAESFDRVRNLGDEMDADARKLQDALEPLEEAVCQPLAMLRESIQSTELREYEPTGDTPEKVRYQYPAELPRTGAHEQLLAAMRETPTRQTPTSPCKASRGVVLPDISLSPPAVAKSSPAVVAKKSPSRPTGSSSPLPVPHEDKNPLSMSLREVDPNLTTTTTTTTTTGSSGSIMFDPSASTASSLLPPPPPPPAGASDESGSVAVPVLKPGYARTRSSRLSTTAKKPVAEGPENIPPSGPLRSSTRRKSPRLH